MSIVQPVDLVDELVSFGTETDRCDVEIFEAHVIGVDEQLLGLDSHELGVQPGTEQLSVEGLVPPVVVVLVSLLEGHSCCVGLDLSDVEEHLVDLLVSVSVRTTEIVRLADSLLHLDAVHDCEGNISNVDRLNFSVHTFDLPVHPVEHLHVHTPLSSDSWVLMKQVNDVGGSDNGHIRVD